MIKILLHVNGCQLLDCTKISIVNCALIVVVVMVVGSLSGSKGNQSLHILAWTRPSKQLTWDIYKWEKL